MQTISREELKKRINSDEDITVVEVLSKDSYDRFHLPTAINVPVDEDFAKNIQEAVPDKNKPVVVYCANTECPASKNAAENLDALGYQNVYDYVEGKKDWKEAGLPTES